MFSTPPRKNYQPEYILDRFTPKLRQSVFQSPAENNYEHMLQQMLPNPCKHLTFTPPNFKLAGQLQDHPLLIEENHIKNLILDYYYNVLDFRKYILISLKNSVYIKEIQGNLEKIQEFLFYHPCSVKILDNGQIIGDNNGNLYFLDKKQQISKFKFQSSRIGVIQRWSGNIVIGNSEGYLGTVDIRLQKLANQIKSHDQEICNIQQDSHFIVTAGNDHFVKLWDTRMFKRILEYQHDSSVRGLLLKENNIFSGGGLGDLNIIKFNIQDKSSISINTQSQVECIFQNLNQIFSLQGDGKIKIFDENLQFIQEWKGHLKSILYGQINNGYLATTSGDQLLKIWDINRNKRFFQPNIANLTQIR